MIVTRFFVSKLAIFTFSSTFSEYLKKYLYYYNRCDKILGRCFRISHTLVFFEVYAEHLTALGGLKKSWMPARLFEK